MRPGPRLVGPLWRPVDVMTLEEVDRHGTPGVAVLKPRALYLMTPDTAQAFRTLRGAGIDAGHDLTIVSAYRAPAHQAKLFAKAVLKYGSEKAARKWVAKESEHATGQTVDFDLGIANSSGNATGGKFAALPIWQWLSVEAPRQGWTPYEREPWHWTFNPLP